MVESDHLGAGDWPGLEIWYEQNWVAVMKILMLDANMSRSP